MASPRQSNRKGLRLRLRRRPDPVLTKDELDFIAARLGDYIGRADSVMARQKVSESLIRGRLTAIDALAKVDEVLESMR